VFREIKGSMANIEKMFELMAISPGVVNVPGAKELEMQGGHIVFAKPC